jgi:glycerophosphoryl diester phosphodiesterase
VPGGVAISAHRGGREAARPGIWEAYRHALVAGAEYVEFDVRRTSDGQLVSFHAMRAPRAPWAGAVPRLSYGRLCDLAGYRVPLAAELMELLAGRALGHLDLKETAGATGIIEQALGKLGPSGFVVTTSAAPVAAGVKRHFPEVAVALTIGGDLAQTAQFTWQRMRAPGLTRLDAALACQADWVAVHHRTARAGLLEECQRHGIKTMVWTVNRRRALARWLSHPRVDIVVTDRPAYAAALRDARQPST